jgi:hypothetical protein
MRTLGQWCGSLRSCFAFVELRLSKCALSALFSFWLTVCAYGQAQIPGHTVLGNPGASQAPWSAIPYATLAPLLGVTVGTSPILAGTSTSTRYGLLYSLNGILGDTSKNGPPTNTFVAGPSIVISANAASVPQPGGAGAPNLFTPNVIIAGKDNDEAILFVGSYGNSVRSSIMLSNVGGTAAAPTKTLSFANSGTTMGLIGVAGYGATQSMPASAAIGFYSTADFTDTSNPTGIKIWTSPASRNPQTTDVQEALTIQPTGGFTFPSTVTGGDPGNGGINATAIKQAGVSVATLGANSFVGAQSLTLSQNAGTTYTISNSNAGTLVTADLFATNGTGAMDVGIGGTGQTFIPILQNMAYLLSTSGSGGLVLDSRGSAKPIVFANNDVEVARLVSANLGIGDNNPAARLVVSRNATQGIAASGTTVALFANADGNATDVQVNAFGTGVFPRILMRESRGTAASPSAVQTGDLLFLTSAQPYDGTSYTTSGAFAMTAAENFVGTTNHGTYASILTTASGGSAVITEQVRVFGSGGLVVGGAFGTDPGAGAILANKFVQSGLTAVASLPTCVAGLKGARWFVTDNATALGFAGVITTGGAIQTPVYCDGTTWRQG